MRLRTGEMSGSHRSCKSLRSALSTRGDGSVVTLIRRCSAAAAAAACSSGPPSRARRGRLSLGCSFDLALSLEGRSSTTSMGAKRAWESASEEKSGEESDEDDEDDVGGEGVSGRTSNKRVCRRPSSNGVL